MFSVPAFRLAMAAMTLVLAGCATSSRPLPKYEKPLAHTQQQTVRTTAYTHSEGDHLQYGRSSALGDTLQSGSIKSAAADWSRWPAGTLFRIQETGELYQVDDYGWALAGTNTIDLYKPSRSAMNAWGVRRVHIEVQQWGDRNRSLSVLRDRSKHAHVQRMLTGLKSDRQPFEPLSAPSLTPPTGEIPAALVAATNSPPPRAQLASLRKPFRP